MKRTLTAVAAISVALLASACSNDSDENVFEPRSGTQQYESAQAIADDLKAAGLTCENLTINETSRYASQAATCQIKGEDIILSVFNSDTDLADNISAFESMLKPVKMEYGLVSGSKWMINCGDTTENENCMEIKAQLGGKLIKPTYF